MAKSLTETARAVIQGKQIIKESDDAAPDRDAKKMTPNAATLRPGSKESESAHANPGAIPPQATGEVQDLGPALVKQGDVPPSAKAAGAVDKDTSKSSKSAVAAEKPKKQDAVMEDAETEGEIMEEDFELTEELEAFIAEMIEQGLSEEEIAQAVEENFEFVTEEKHEDEDEDEDEKDEKGKDEKDDKKEKMDETYQIDMSEHVDALLAGEDLSEEFKAKATTIFEAAVTAKLEEEVAKIQEAYAQTLEEEVTAIKEQLSENVDEYLNYVVENWISENEVAIEAGLRTELTEEFISGLRQLFAENYIDIPEDKISVVEEMGTKVTELETKLNEEIERNVALTKSLNESKQGSIVESACDGLTTTQAEKLRTLSEGIEFTSDKEFAKKIQTLRENYFPVNVNAENVLDSVETDQEAQKLINEDLKGPMASYVRTLGKKLPN